MISHRNDPEISLSRWWREMMISELQAVPVLFKPVAGFAPCEHTNLRTFVRRGPDEIAALVQAAGQDVTSEGPRRAEHRPMDGGYESIVFFHTDTLAKSPHRHGRSHVFARTHTGAHTARTHLRSAPLPPPPPSLCPLPPPDSCYCRCRCCCLYQQVDTNLLMPLRPLYSPLLITVYWLSLRSRLARHSNVSSLFSSPYDDQPSVAATRSLFPFRACESRGYEHSFARWSSTDRCRLFFSANVIFFPSPPLFPKTFLQAVSCRSERDLLNDRPESESILH